jgi:hypothetical protein
MTTSFSAGEPVVYSTDGGPWQNIAPHLAEGSKARVVPAAKGLQEGVPLVWGLLRGSPEIIGQAIQANRPWVYLDHGYWKRGHFHGHYRMTWCAFQQNRIKPAPDDRWKKLGVELKPWHAGDYIVVCKPSDHVAKMFGAEDWLETTCELLKKHTDRLIVRRRKDDPIPLPKMLLRAHALVAFNSIAAVEAVTLGTPVFVPKGSAASPMGETDLTKIEDPLYPEREGWAHSLAYGQFTIEEMRDGTAWRLLRKF